MKPFRITMLVILSLIDIYCIYSMIGQLIIAIKTPKLIGESTTVLVGSYIISLGFIFATLIVTFLILLIAIRLKKNK